MSDHHSLAPQIELAMHADQFSLRQMWKAVQSAERAGKPFDRLLTKLLSQLEKSCRRREQRAAWQPRLDWDDELPVVARRQEVAETIAKHQVVVLCGETGSGKSTQLPKILIEMGRGLSGIIGHTQPRRIAARSVAARLAEEMNGRLGHEVGFRIRFTDSSGPNTRVRLMTDGILLAETQTDRFLDAYDTIIVDEAHERSLNIDFLLGYLKRLLPKRRDLKVIITSATIDAARFAEHFVVDDAPAPVLQISGRMFPVELRYRPLDEANDPGGDTEPRDWLDGVADAVDELASTSDGHILVFLPTERDIREAAKRLGGRRYPGDTPERPTDIVPLFGRLSMADQTRVFAPYPHRRIVLATNVAESSLTVPGVRFVVDTGTARISRYSARSRMQRLPIEAVSQASANQRAGRCGRVGPGICIRLYSQQDFDSREPFTAPEIQRTNLAAVILRTISLKLGSIEDFPFLDPPKITTVREGYKTLEELGAIADDGQLTEVGRRMARLPVDPRISRIILAAIDEHVLADVLPIAALLECQDPRDRPLDKQQAADEAHRQFVNRDSDFLTILNLWNAWHEQQRTQSNSQVRRWCQKNFLSWLRMREWVDVHEQLRELLEDSDDPVIAKAAVNTASHRRAGRVSARSAPHATTRSAARREPRSSASASSEATLDFAAIHRALLTGLLANIGCQTPQGDFIGAGGNSLAIWPGSGLAPKGAKWFVAGELVETSRRFARTIARVQPEWIEPLAGHLLTREHFEPHWDAAAGNVMVFEKVSLWGLPIVPRRKINYARVDPVKAREMLIQHGLVEWGLWFGATVDADSAVADYDDEEESLSRGATRVRPGRAAQPAGRSDVPRKGWGRDFPFFRHNLDVLDQLKSLQARTRSHHLVPSDEVLFEFYASRVPESCCDRDRLRQWYRDAVAKSPGLLQLNVADFAADAERREQADAFPESAQFGTLHLPLTYQLAPGHEADGVTVTVPLEGLGQLHESRLDWLVPGLIEQRILALIRSLPKDLRRHFVPAPDTASRMTRELEFAKGDLLAALAAKLSQTCGERFDARAFDVTTVPDHLRFNIRVIDNARKTLIEGRDLKELRAELVRRAGADANRPSAGQVPGASAEEVQWQRAGFASWDFNDVPERIEIHRAGMLLPAFPAIRDDGDTVSLTLCQTATDAERVLRGGLRRLFLLTERKRVLTQVGNVPRISQVRVLAVSIKGLEFTNQLSLLMTDRAYLADQPLPRTRAAFDKAIVRGRERLGVVAQEFTQFLPHLFQSFHETRRELDQARGPGWDALLTDMRTQLANLMHATMLIDTPWPWLIQFPRYFQAIRQRLQRLSSGGLRTESAQMSELTPWLERFRQAQADADRQKRVDPRLQHLRWMLEEFRVQLFAQKLGTAVTVSSAKLAEALDVIARG